MDRAREIALDLLQRLLAGERDPVQLHLGMLLEKSCSMADSDEFYRWMLPPEIAEVKLSRQTWDEVMSALSAEISKNPDEGLINVIGDSASNEAIRTVSTVLAKPPRPMTLTEYAAAMALVSTLLPFCLVDDPNFLPDEVLDELLRVATRLRNTDLSETVSSDPSIRSRIEFAAPNLIKTLTEFHSKRR